MSVMSCSSAVKCGACVCDRRGREPRPAAVSVDHVCMGVCMCVGGKGRAACGMETADREIERATDPARD